MGGDRRIFGYESAFDVATLASGGLQEFKSLSQRLTSFRKSSYLFSCAL